MNVQAPLRMDKAAFFGWAERQDGRRYELVEGVPIMMPFVKRNHALICANIAFALRERLDLAAYNVTIGDFGVGTGERSIRYADVMIETAGGGGDERETDRAVVLVEVLSDSTTHLDFGEKRLEYQALATLQAYVIAAQRERRIWLWSRSQDQGWPAHPAMLDGETDAVTLAAPVLTVPLSAIYRGISFT